MYWITKDLPSNVIGNKLLGDFHNKFLWESNFASFVEIPGCFRMPLGESPALYYTSVHMSTICRMAKWALVLDDVVVPSRLYLSHDTLLISPSFSLSSIQAEVPPNILYIQRGTASYSVPCSASNLFHHDSVIIMIALLVLLESRRPVQLVSVTSVFTNGQSRIFCRSLICRVCPMKTFLYSGCEKHYLQLLANLSDLLSDEQDQARLYVAYLSYSSLCSLSPFPHPPFLSSSRYGLKRPVQL